MRDHFLTTGNILGCFLLIVTIGMEMKISLQTHCSLPKVLITSQHGYALVGKEYKSFTSQDFHNCMKECKKDEPCMSVNFHIVTKTCDLNTQNKESLPAMYKERNNSIYMTNSAFLRAGPVIGLSQNKPGKSCLEILIKGGSIGTGVYWIDPANTGKPMQAYCDMTTDGGGWTIVKKTILQTTYPLSTREFIENITVIAQHDMNSKWVVPEVQAIMDIKNKMGFYQFHFYCHKKSVGRAVSIMTKNNTDGQAVVDFFTGPALATVFPTACGSFDRLPDDTSFLSQNCAKWGTTALVNQWGDYGHHGSSRLGTIPFKMDVPPTYFYGHSKDSADGIGFRYLCDDSYSAPEPYNVGDIWQISVR